MCFELGKSDNDIIREIYEYSASIIIFYQTENKDYEQKIINLIDTLGKEETLQGYPAEKLNLNQ